MFKTYIMMDDKGDSVVCLKFDILESDIVLTREGALELGMTMLRIGITAGYDQELFSFLTKDNEIIKRFGSAKAKQLLAAYHGVDTETASKAQGGEPSDGIQAQEPAAES